MLRMGAFAAPVMACFGAFAIHCGGDSLSTASAEIGVSGGHLATGTGADAASIEIPAGALAATRTITIRQGSLTDSLPGNANAGGPLFVFGPEGQTFATPVTITLPTTVAANAVFTRPVGSSTWTRVTDVTPDPAHHAIVVHVSHFSEFVPGMTTACMADSDCSASQRCNAMTNQCEDVGSAIDAGPAPDASMGANCVSDSDCPSGMVCDPMARLCSSSVVSDASAPVDASMGGGCNSDADCPSGSTCNAMTRLCAGSSASDAGSPVDAGAMGVACNSDADCASGSRCNAMSHTCSTATSSDAGAAMCSSGHADCDANAMNGCEVNLLADSSNCGACGVVCSSGHTCSQGACH